MPSTTIKYFAFAHLPLNLQTFSKPLGELAQHLEQALPDGPEKSAGMRKLLEAKDCFVRSALDIPRDAAPEPKSDLPPHQQRVVEEHADLGEKIAKLNAFLGTDLFSKLDRAEQSRLNEQHDAMSSYAYILCKRIAAFTAA